MKTVYFTWYKYNPERNYKLIYKWNKYGLSIRFYRVLIQFPKLHKYDKMSLD